MTSRRSRRKLSDAAANLNQRLAALGERDKELAAIEQTTASRQAELEALQSRLSDAGARLTARLGTLGRA